jgi:hypothetical protein
VQLTDITELIIRRVLPGYHALLVLLLVRYARAEGARGNRGSVSAAWLYTELCLGAGSCTVEHQIRQENKIRGDDYVRNGANGFVLRRRPLRGWVAASVQAQHARPAALPAHLEIDPPLPWLVVVRLVIVCSWRPPAAGHQREVADCNSHSNRSSVPSATYQTRRDRNCPYISVGKL